MVLNATELCILCDKPDADFCEGCKSTRYCSKECQQTDWPTHKLLCADFSSFDPSSRPSTEHFRAILFPVDEEKPKFIWLDCNLFTDENIDSGRYHIPEIRTFLGPYTSPRHAAIHYNLSLNRGLSDTIHIFHRDGFLVDGSKPNKSILSITTTTAGQKHDWRGPIIAFGKLGLGTDQRFCKDLDMNDFRHIADYFLSYKTEPTPTPQQYPSTTIKGVMINCIGDQKMFGKPRFEAVEVSSTDLIFSEHDTSQIADRIDLPIFTRRCPPNPLWANNWDTTQFDHTSPFNNQDATFLHLCCDPNAEFDLSSEGMCWGWAPMKWQNKVGSTLVVRQDKKPLLPLHVEALCRYCRYEIHPLLSHSQGVEYAPEKPIKMDLVLAIICRPTFVICWHKLMDEKHEAREDTSGPYPYYDVET